jgi:hypothetical protein
VKLLPSQWDDVFLAIGAAGLAPGDFERSEAKVAGRPTDVLTYRATSYYFRFRTGQRESHFSEFSPGGSTEVQTANPGTWPSQLGRVQEWLGYLRRELDTPNLWDRLAIEQGAERVLGRPVEGEETNTPFSPDELAEIHQTLHEIKDLIAGSVNLTAPQAADLDARIRYLESTAKRSPRFDWWNIVFSQLVQFVTQWALSGDLLRSVLHTASTALGRFFGVPTSSDMPRIGPSGDDDS